MQHSELIYEFERYKVVPGYDNYFVAADGRIVSIAKGSLREMKPMINESGYAYVYMYRGRKQKKIFVHHAVLLAWVGPRPPHTEGRHLNDDKTDNHYKNLAWGTRQDNVNDKVANGVQPRGEKTGSAKLTEAQVLEIRKRIKDETLRSLAAEYGVSHTTIRRAAKGIKWKHLTEVKDDKN